jgi:hypothetical protein
MSNKVAVNSGVQKSVFVISVLIAVVMGAAVMKSFAGSRHYVAMRQMIPVGQSLEEAEILYEIAKQSTGDCLASTQVSATLLSSAPEPLTSDTLIGYLEDYCDDLGKLAEAVKLQEKQKEMLKTSGECQLSSWAVDVAGIQNIEKRTVEENKIARARMEFTSLMRQAEEELAAIHATMVDGRDIEIYIVSLKHADKMGTTSESLRTLKNELTLKADSFRSRTNDVLAGWK